MALLFLRFANFSPNPYYFLVNRILFVLLILAIAFVSAGAQKQPRSKKKTAPAKPAAVAPIPMPETYRELLANAQQMIVVTTPGWNHVDGTLRRYEKHNGQWEQVGDQVPIVVGKSGLGWDGDTEPPSPNFQPIKKEGDGRSPAGVFRITEIFGFPEVLDTKLPYQPLTDSIECVDDPSSQAYNQIVDRKEIPHPDWNSSEKMRTIDQYKLGAVVDYNSPKVPDTGSCIFLHIWNGPGHGTAGCTAMDESELKDVLNWLDKKKNPILVQFPAAMYNQIRSGWQLP